jgi:hypothetical protein
MNVRSLGLGFVAMVALGAAGLVFSILKEFAAQGRRNGGLARRV